MTEAEWLACAAPGPMLEWLQDQADGRWRVSERKLWLYAAAASRDMADSLVSDAGHVVLDGLADWAEGGIALAELRRLVDQEEAREQAEGQQLTFSSDEGEDATYTMGYLAGLCRRAGRRFGGEIRSYLHSSRLAWMLREVVGNPFRRHQVAPAWLAANDGAVLRLASHIVSAQDDADTGILADALEDAGCDDQDILEHLRSPWQHLRGCWALDLLLAKE